MGFVWVFSSKDTSRIVYQILSKSSSCLERGGPWGPPPPPIIKLSRWTSCDVWLVFNEQPVAGIGNAHHFLALPCPQVRTTHIRSYLGFWQQAKQTEGGWKEELLWKYCRGKSPLSFSITVPFFSFTSLLQCGAYILCFLLRVRLCSVCLSEYY